MSESTERYFRLMPVGRRSRPASRMWVPAADVFRVADGWLVKVELAGVCPDEIEISITGQTIRITGCRRDAFYGENVHYHQLEITYSRFEKTLRFPCQIEGASLEQSYRDGLLILQLRSREAC